MIGYPSVMRFFRLGSDDVNGDIMNKIITVMLLLSILIISGCAALDPDQSKSYLALQGSSVWGRLPPCDYNKTAEWSDYQTDFPEHMRNCEIKRELIYHSKWIDSKKGIWNTIYKNFMEVGIFGKLDGFSEMTISDEVASFSCYDNGSLISRFMPSEPKNLVSDTSSATIPNSSEAEVIKSCEGIRSGNRLTEYLTKECSSLGLQANSPDFNQCLIQLRVAFLQKPASRGSSSASENYMVRPTTSTADRLEGIAQILNAFTKTPASSGTSTNRSNPPPMSKTCSYKSGVYEWSEVTNLLMCPSSSNKGGIIGVLAP